LPYVFSFEVNNKSFFEDFLAFTKEEKMFTREKIDHACIPRIIRDVMPLEYTAEMATAFEAQQYHEVVRLAQFQAGIVLTATCRDELIDILAASADPAADLRGCMTAYNNAIQGGDTSISFTAFRKVAQRSVHLTSA
jgi:hypothetical protein